MNPTTKLPHGWRAFALSAAGLGLVAGAGGCAPDLDTSRESVDRGSFGETLATLVCKRIAYLEDLEDGDGRVDVSGERFREACRGTAPAPADAAPALDAYLAQRDAVAAAIDAMWPDAILGDLQAYATSLEFLAGYDDGTIEQGALAMSGMLGEVADDAEALRTVERLALREGYTPESDGILASLTSAPELEDVLRHATDDLAPGGAANEPVKVLAAGAANELQELEAPADPADPERVGRLAFDLLLREHPSFGADASLLVAQRDPRGVAVIAPLGDALPAPFVDGDGDGLADVDDLGRYVDENGAVIDAPTPLPIAGEDDPAGTVRDELGRPVDPETTAPLYAYLSPDDSLLVAAMREAAVLVEPERGIAFDLVLGAGALMGPRIPATQSYDSGATVSYEGFDTTASPILDLAYAALQIVRAPDALDALDMVNALLGDHEPAIAGLAEALIEALHVPGELGALGEAAELADDTTLLDDLTPTLRQIVADEALFRDVVAAVQDPAVASLIPYFADYMRYADAYGYNPESFELVRLSDGTPATALSEKVDRALPDAGRNRSIFQRVLHLLSDVNGLPLCSKAGAFVDEGPINIDPYEAECELLEIDNLAVFYVKSLGFVRDANGNFVTSLHLADPDVGETSGVCNNGSAGPFVRAARLPFDWGDELDGFEITDNQFRSFVAIEGFGNCPTPQALNRMLFLDPAPQTITNIIDPPANRHGQVLGQLHAGSVAAWELGEFYDLVQPLAQPFIDHGAEQLFVDLLVALNNHWPSRESETYQQNDPAGAAYAYASNLVSYEPVVVEVLDRGNLFPAVVEGARVIDSLTVNGRDAVAILRGVAEYLLSYQPPAEGEAPALSTRTGGASVTRPDGSTVTEIAPWHLLAGAVSDSFDAIEDSGARGEAFEDAVSEIADVLLRAELVADPESGETDWRFRNPRMRGMGLIIVEFLRERVRVHGDAGDIDAWASQELPADLEELLAGPLVAGASDLVAALDSDPEARRALEGLLAHALSEERDPAAFRGMAALIADTLQLALVGTGALTPLAHALGRVLDPARGWLDPALALTGVVGPADTQGVLATTVRNLFTVHQAGDTPFDVFADAIGDVQRVAPVADAGERLDAADYEAVLRGLAEFLSDEKRGLRKFVAIIRGRNLN